MLCYVFYVIQVTPACNVINVLCMYLTHVSIVASYTVKNVTPEIITFKCIGVCIKAGNTLGKDCYQKGQMFSASHQRLLNIVSDDLSLVKSDSKSMVLQCTCI